MAALSKYQAWLNAGRPYFEGLAMLNELPGMYPLKRTLSRGPSTYNSAKLQHMLRAHFSKVKATAAKATGQALRDQLDEALERADQLQEERDELELDLQDAADGERAARRQAAGASLPPEPYSTSKLKALPFADLPTPLQRWRIETAERYTKRSLAHRHLREGIGDPRQRQATVRDIVELTDAINAYWKAERAYARTGAVPQAQPTEAQRIEALDPFAAQRELVNQVRPRRHRLKSKLLDKALDADTRRGLEMQLQDTERTKHLLEQRVRAYDRQRNT